MKRFRLLIVLGLGLLVAALVLVPALNRARIGGGPTGMGNLKLLQSAKSEFAQAHNLTNEVSLPREELLTYGLGGHWPKCPKGGDYTLGSLHESPRCSCPAHAQLQVPAN